MTEIALDLLERSLDREGDASAPKYQRLVAAFRACIGRGEFRPGDRVPTERELSMRLPVSLGTLQKAMARLAEAGLIVRSRRTGTFIAERGSQVPEVHVYRYRDPETGRMRLPYTRVLAIRVERGAGPWREALGVAAPVRVDRLVWVEGERPAFSSLFLRPEHGTPLLGRPPESLDGSSCHRVLVERFALPTLRMEHRVRADALSERAAGALGHAPGTAGLIWDVLDFSLDGRPTLFQRFELPPGHWPMQIVEERGPAAAGSGTDAADTDTRTETGKRRSQP